MNGSTACCSRRSRDRLASVVLGRWAGGCITLVVCAGALALTLEALRARWLSTAARREAGLDFALLLAAAGIGLVLAPELLYLHDSFGTRMNTVFKFWYQAWLLLACGAAVGIASALRRGRGRTRRGAARAARDRAGSLLSGGRVVVAHRRVRLGAADARRAGVARALPSRGARGAALAARVDQQRRRRGAALGRELPGRAEPAQHRHRPRHAAGLGRARVPVARLVVLELRRRS